MLKKLLPLLLCLLMLLSACGSPSGIESEEPGTSKPLSIVCSTYPIYLFASEVAKDAEGVTVAPLVNQDLGCLHGYTMTVNDMKLLEGADLLLLNGLGLDDFILSSLDGAKEDALQIVSLSDSIAPLSSLNSHQGFEDASQDDPHYWMDPARAAEMMSYIADVLGELDPENKDLYRQNADKAMLEVITARDDMRRKLEILTGRELITFHDGFRYFADAFNFTILMSVEEEEGQEASAKVMEEAISLIDAYGLPAIFTEVNSSDATAQAIAQETGVTVYPLSMIMSGKTENVGIDTYISAMDENVNNILVALR